MIHDNQKQHIICNFGLSIILYTILFLTLQLTSLESKTINDVNSCNQIKGNWRAYGNSCVDNCLPQYNKSLPCVNAITYGCDCGDDSCLYRGECHLKSKFDTKFQEILINIENQEITRREEVVDKMESDPDYSRYINNLFPKKTNPQLHKIKSKAQLASEQFLSDSKAMVDKENQSNEPKIEALPESNIGKAIGAASESNKKSGNQNKKEPPIPQIPDFLIDKGALKPSSKNKTSKDVEITLPSIPLPR